MTLYQPKGITILAASDARSCEMRPVIAILLTTLLLASCSKQQPPLGRWEGTYEVGGTFIAARLEMAANAQIRVSAPDVTDSDVDTDRLQMEQNMSDRLAGAWGAVEPRPMDFDGTTFRKPGGIAPQIEWESASNTMTLYVYLGNRPAIRIRLHRVDDFSQNPWPR